MNSDEVRRYRALASSVLAVAVQDARRDDERGDDARQFLAGGDSLDLWMQWLGLDSRRPASVRQRFRPAGR